MTDTFQWQRCSAADPGDGTTCVNIPGATGSTYPEVAADVGHRLRVTAARDGVDIGPSSMTAPVVAAGVLPTKLLGFATGFPAGNAFDPHYTLDAFIAKVVALHANFLRFDVPNSTNYSGTIARVRACKANGIHVMLTPVFQSSASAYATLTVGAINALSAAGVPLDGNDWLEFGNEVNLSGPRITPEAYAPWHRTVYNAVAATGSPVKIGTGSLASFGQYGSVGSGIDMVYFTERMLAADPNLGNTFHALSCHPYGFSDNDSVADLENYASPYNGLGQSLYHSHSLLTALDAHAASAGKPLMMNEVGVDTDEPPWTGGVSESVQAQYYADLVSLARTTTRVTGLGIYSVLDKSDVISTGSSREGSFGVYHPNFAEKPSAAAVRSAILA